MSYALVSSPSRDTPRSGGRRIYHRPGQFRHAPRWHREVASRSVSPRGRCWLPCGHRLRWDPPDEVLGWHYHAVAPRAGVALRRRIANVQSQVHSRCGGRPTFAAGANARYFPARRLRRCFFTTCEHSVDICPYPSHTHTDDLNSAVARVETWSLVRAVRLTTISS